jgi:leucyl aminopeptidase
MLMTHYKQKPLTLSKHGGFSFMSDIYAPAHNSSVPIYPVYRDTLQTDLDRAGAGTWGQAAGFAGKSGEILPVPNKGGGLHAVLLGMGTAQESAINRFAYGVLPGKLPAGLYHIEANLPHKDAFEAALGWGLGAYRFTKYRTLPLLKTYLVPPPSVPVERLEAVLAGMFLTRDLVNTPAGDLGPEALEQVCTAFAQRHGAAISTIVGDDLLAQNFPMIHAVGRAAAQPPRLLDLRWQPEKSPMSLPKVTLVGKGITFDTGGLDIKPSSAMRNMKKDMGGAATVLGLAEMILRCALPVQLRVLIPAAENAIAGDAFRPGDILHSRKGFTVEVGNTDAEGRLVLADALALADEEAPDLIINMATLTGAARVALGPDLMPFYTLSDPLAAELTASAERERDPLWRMPLWAPYDAGLKSSVADMGNITATGFAGSITAALFLGRFIETTPEWVHFDLFAWNPASKPGRPEGGECQAARAVFGMLEQRYG